MIVYYVLLLLGSVAGVYDTKDACDRAAMYQSGSICIQRTIR